ncbi:hypothetical protein [Aliiruegeria lutimaris]|uniref:hypothetical protein n=1 Tax=Aliiruegeria lutimaris TaxID=571298 RepID=UPI001113548C|nr:hypothetical protein [Aliiruegeria lutimaris]
MPDLRAILAFYQAIAFFSATGALAGEARCCAWREHEAMVQAFLSPVERSTIQFLSKEDRAVRLRKGETRFRTWEAANPDIVDFLKAKAENLAYAPQASDLMREVETHVRHRPLPAKDRPAREEAPSASKNNRKLV